MIMPISTGCSLHGHVGCIPMASFSISYAATQGGNWAGSFPKHCWWCQFITFVTAFITILCKKHPMAWHGTMRYDTYCCRDWGIFHPWVMCAPTILNKIYQQCELSISKLVHRSKQILLGSLASQFSFSVSTCVFLHKTVSWADLCTHNYFGQLNYEHAIAWGQMEKINFGILERNSKLYYKCRMLEQTQ